MEEGRRAWDTIWDAGQRHGLVPVGIGVYGTTGRLEEGYPAFGAELDGSYTLVEAGMTPPSGKEQPFLGRGAYLAPPAAPAFPGAFPPTPGGSPAAAGPPR